MSQAERAERLLELASAASRRFEDGLVAQKILASESDKPARIQARERARHLFVFVLLSVLLEEHAGADPADKETGEKLKELFAAELVGARKQLKKVSEKALKPEDAAAFSKKLDSDPFGPYYGSFEKMRQNADLGPFGIFARRLADENFAGPSRAAVYEKVFTLAAALSDELLGAL